MKVPKTKSKLLQVSVFNEYYLYNFQGYLLCLGWK